MKILMTGATGFLGSNLLARLVAESDTFQVTILKRSFSNTWRISSLLSGVSYFDLDSISLKKIFETGSYDTILHCATDYGRKQINRSEMIEANLLLPLRLLENSIANGVQHFINTDTLLDKQVSAYALSKQQFKEWLKDSKNSIRTTTVSLEHFYGPGDDPSKFVTSIIRSLLEEIPVLPLTLGQQRRDFVYIEDVVECFMFILREFKLCKSGYQEFDIGYGDSISIRQFVELAKKICGNKKTRLDFGALPYREHEPMDICAKALDMRKLGWCPCITIEEGLRRTINFERALIK